MRLTVGVTDDCDCFYLLLSYVKNDTLPEVEWAWHGSIDKKIVCLLFLVDLLTYLVNIVME